MKSKLVIGNWKMNKSFEEAEDLITELEEALEGWNLNTTVAICPPSIYLELASDHAEESNFSCGAQNCSEFKNGAYTGEISASMLAELGVDFCIAGHSERRKYFHETDAQIAQKIDQLIENSIIPVFCCGETVDIRESNQHLEFVKSQIQESLFHLSKPLFENIIIAYEPVWAIGTGLTATPRQAQEMHAFIRQLIEQKYGAEIAYNVPVIYGGSCSPDNALDLFSQNDVDGGLIGGASLNIKDFSAIIEAAETASKEN